MSKKIKCNKCGKTWYRHLTSIVNKKDLPYYCPWCEVDKLGEHPPIKLNIREKKMDKHT